MSSTTWRGLSSLSSSATASSPFLFLCWSGLPFGILAWRIRSWSLGVPTTFTGNINILNDNSIIFYCQVDVRGKHDSNNYIFHLSLRCRSISSSTLQETKDSDKHSLFWWQTYFLDNSEPIWRGNTTTLVTATVLLRELKILEESLLKIKGVENV